LHLRSLTEQALKPQRRKFHLLLSCASLEVLMGSYIRTDRELLSNHEKQIEVEAIAKQVISIVVLAAITVLLPGCSRSADSDAAYIRLNQVGYEIGPVRLYLMSKAPQKAPTFTVKKSSGEEVFSGVVGNSGTWGKFNVYPMDFTISATGSYAVTVSGSHPASATFSVDTPGQLCAQPLNNALRFYQDQRDGSEYIPSALRTAPAHLNDQRANVYRRPEFGLFEGIKGDLVPTGLVVDVEGAGGTPAII